MKEPTVVILTGVTGTGKTTLLERFRDAHAGSLQILSPTAIGQLLDVQDVNWDTYAGIAIDEVAQWDRATAPAAIIALEQEAISRGKKLFLVTQVRDQLSRTGIELSSAPMIIELHGIQESVSLAFNGHNIVFPEPVVV